MRNSVGVLPRRRGLFPTAIVVPAAQSQVAEKQQRRVELGFRLMAIEIFTDFLATELRPPLLSRKLWRKLDAGVLEGRWTDTSLSVLVAYAFGRVSDHRNIFLTARFSSGHSGLEELHTNLNGIGLVGLEKVLTHYNKSRPKVVQMEGF